MGSVRSCKRDPPGSETVDHRRLGIHQEDLHEADAKPLRDSVQRLDEFCPTEVLSNDHVVAAAQVFLGHGDRQRAGQELRLLVLLPPAERHANRVDLEVQCQRVVFGVAGSDGRLPDSRRAVHQDQLRDGSSLGSCPTPSLQFGLMLNSLLSAESALEVAARDFDPSACGGAETVAFLEKLGAIRRLTDGMIAKAAKRLEDTAEHTRHTDRSAAELCARLTGVSAGE